MTPEEKPPKKIWLQWNNPNPHEGVLWCEDKINDDDIEYIMPEEGWGYQCPNCAHHITLPDHPFEKLPVAKMWNQIARRKMGEFLDYCKEHFSDRAWFHFTLETSQFLQAWEEWLNQRGE